MNKENTNLSNICVGCRINLNLRSVKNIDNITEDEAINEQFSLFATVGQIGRGWVGE